ncbi:MAG TPA: cell division protein FtsA [Thermoanaerobaculia bacterium]|jgi:cell division protein FtsA
MARPDPYLVGIDVGSSKVGVLIGQRGDAGGVEVVGKGLAPNRGTRRGNIVNVEQTVDALKQAAEEAEVMAGVEISRAYVGIAGSDVRSINSRAIVSVSRRDREITRQDVKRALDAAQAAALPADREVLHAVPQEFVVDDQGGINEPVGMLASRLEVAVHLVTGNGARTKTLQTCVNRAGIEVVELVFEPLATATAVLTPDERELSVLLIDVGGGGTEYSLFAEGAVQHSAVLPIGASHFTSDLAMVLRTPFAEAERLKTRYGCCLESLIDEDQGVTVTAVAGGPKRLVPRRQLCEILQPRAEELLTLIRDDLARNGWDDALRGGVVLTGGGAKLDGLLEIAQQLFGATVRYGMPRGLGGLVDVINSPTWASASGLLLYGLVAEEHRGRARRQPFTVKRMIDKVRGVFSDLL